MSGSNSRGWVFLTLGGSKLRWWVSSRQVMGSKWRLSGMGHPLKMRSPKGMRPLNPSRLVMGGWVKGVPWACQKCLWLCSRRWSSIWSMSVMQTHSGPVGIKRCISLLGIEGCRMCQMSAKHCLVSLACLSPRMSCFLSLLLVAHVSHNRSLRCWCWHWKALHWISHSLWHALCYQMEIVSGGVRGRNFDPRQSLIALRACAWVCLVCFVLRLMDQDHWPR